MGTNSIRKIAPGKYRLDVRIVKAGKESRKRLIFHGTKAQAEEKHLQLKTELRFGAWAVARKVRYFRDILELYREKSPPFSPQRLCMFSQIMRDLGEIDLSSFPDRLETFLKIIAVTPTKKTGKPLSNASRNRLMQMVDAALNMAVKMEVLEKNPLIRARFPKLREVARDRILSPEEMLRLSNVIATEAPHLGPMVSFALQVPCRKSELIHMVREDLDLFSNAIRVHNGTTKNDEGIWKPIPPDMTAYFRSLPPECPYLFHRKEKGEYRPIGDFKTAWKRCLQFAGITNFRFHDTRHISASAMLDNGTPERVVMQVAGWNTDMIRNYYHRAGKNSLSLVRFETGNGHSMDTAKVERAKVS